MPNGKVDNYDFRQDYEPEQKDRTDFKMQARKQVLPVKPFPCHLSFFFINNAVMSSAPCQTLFRLPFTLSAPLSLSQAYKHRYLVVLLQLSDDRPGRKLRLVTIP